VVFSRFCETLGAKNTINTDVFAPRKTKTTLFTLFFASGSKNHCMYMMFFGKNTGIYTVFQHVARHIFSMPKAQKHCKLQCFGSWQAQKK